MNNINIKNYEFLKCLSYTNSESEILTYKYIENLIYGKFNQKIIDKNYAELIKLNPEKFTENIKNMLENKNDKQIISSSRKNVKDIMLESYAIKKNKSKAELEKYKMYIFLKKIPGKNIIFDDGEIIDIII